MIEETSEKATNSKFLLENLGLQLNNLKIRKIGTDIEDLSFISPSNSKINLTTRFNFSKSCQKVQKSSKKLLHALKANENQLETDKIFIETLEGPEKSSSELRLLTKTPSFSRTKSQELEELKEMFDKLKSEQEKLKSQLSLQKNLIKMIGNNFQAPGIAGKTGESESRIRKTSKAFSSMLKSKTPNKTRTTRLLGDLNTSQNSSKLLDDSFTLPVLSSINSDRKITSNKFTFLKYSRDLPVLSKNLKLPKDVFVVKK
jgi:hypothetical protein